MKHVYFISFSCAGPSGEGLGFGNAEVKMNYPITSIKHTHEIVQKLGKQYPKTTLLYYQLLRTE